MLRSGCDIGVFQIGLFYQISKNDIVFCISRNNNPYPPAVFEILLDCFPQISYYVHLLENIRVRFVSSLFHCKCIESLHKKQQKINILQHNYPPPSRRGGFLFPMFIANSLYVHDITPKAVPMEVGMAIDV